MVSYWEAGTRVPNDRQLAVLSQLLRVPIGMLVGYEEAETGPDRSVCAVAVVEKEPLERPRNLVVSE